MNAQRTNTIGVGVKLVGLTLAAAMATGLGCSDGGGNAPTGKGGSGGATAGTTGTAGSTAGTGGSTTGTGGSTTGTGGSTTGTGGSTTGTGGNAGSTAGTGGNAGSMAGTGGNAGSTAGTGGHAGTGGMAGAGGNGGTGGPANLPPTLNVPAGAMLKLKLHATGDQVYTCTASAAGGTGGAGGAGGSGATTYSWVLKQPDAKLYDASNTQVGTHGLGPNWTSTVDGSVVNGAKVYQESSPTAGAIPWLLLRATSNTGTGVFSDVTYVQRANTTGGVAPATGCDSTTVGTETRAAYTADYYFYSGGGAGTAWMTLPSNVPPTLNVPSGATLKIHDHAIGVQVYTCTASAAGGAGGGGGAGGSGATTYAWVLKQPDAVLYDSSFAQVGTHGLGPNWTSTDGSVVNGAKAYQESSTTAGAIPWLLLRATSNSGTGAFSDVTYVQRLNTAGGPAPSGGCDSTTAGTDTRIPYSADYYFYSGGGPGTAWTTPPANLPAAIAVPSGATFALHYHAIGVQVYTCTPSAAGGAGGSGAGGAGGSGATTYAWVLKQPDAVLYDASFAQAGTHGLGPNWTSTDGSVVNGAKVAGVNSTATGAIQWLLLMATSNTGTGVFSNITYVQRLNTAGGPAPATGCDATTTADVRIPYSADYYFFTGGTTTADGGTNG